MRLAHLKTVLLLLPLLGFGGDAAPDIITGQGSDDAKGRPILDQYNTDTLSSSLNGGSGAYEWQQGVTAGITGQLSRLALYVVLAPDIGETASTQISVSVGPPWRAGAPAWMTVTAPVVSGWNSFDLSKAKIFVTAGDEYVIGIHGQSASNFNPAFGISYGDQYVGGDLFLNGSTAGSEGNDLLFRTYVKQQRSGR
jgi:hypothetical protein